MKKLCVAGLVSISLLTYSCSNDEESYEVQARDFKTTPQSFLKVNFPTKIIDTTTVKLGTDAVNTDAVELEGDPSILKPPR
ncbi:hypothetical protein E0I26_11035 [Flavobacterium rhamnosiphilum]|uniref:Uncharacterized protein n=1 Tax=Flavobacterium rhamnosiphilum TaxID=2541724 RepID=A0A4R5F6L0_9FLAO|nr:hypothetical protein [Flavobacterium rhamnosiphilum]TDE43578.1 hypothetical protein E0I26_11035 [Flavobacterium rhamnosiphilum]